MKVSPPIPCRGYQVQIWVLARLSLTGQSLLALALYFACFLNVAIMLAKFHSKLFLCTYFILNETEQSIKDSALKTVAHYVFLWCMTSVECHKLITFLITALY